MKQKILNLPEKQSNWCHIPLGRILDPLNKEELNNLFELANLSQNTFNFCTEVNKFHLIHEHRWYQLERENLCTVELLN